jgi:hypothetical protein
VILPLEEYFNSYSLGSHRAVLHATLRGDYYLLLYSTGVSLKKIISMEGKRTQFKFTSLATQL